MATHVGALMGFAVMAAERGEPVRLDRPFVARWVREGCARALLFVLAPLGLGQGRPAPSGSGKRGPDEGRAPVLLVPGHGQNRSALAFLRIFLTSRGWAWVWPVNVSTSEGGLADRASELSRRVDELLRVTGAEQVDIVGHGLGGLAAAWYVRHLDGAPKVRRLVTLATPWRGTKMAVFGGERLAEDLRLDAPALDALAPPPVPTVAVWSPVDNDIVPAASAVPEGAESVEVADAGHTEMLISARIYRAVQAALSHLPSTTSRGEEAVSP